jgi:hypothetical protein
MAFSGSRARPVGEPRAGRVTDANEQIPVAVMVHLESA